MSLVSRTKKEGSGRIKKSEKVKNKKKERKKKKEPSMGGERVKNKALVPFENDPGSLARLLIQ